MNHELPVARLISKEYATGLRKSISMQAASKSSPALFEWPPESQETTHLSVVDAGRNAVALTFTLEEGYGSRIVVRGAGFLLNNEMGDFNPAPGLTTKGGLIGTAPNLVKPGKRMLSSMTPTILAKNGSLLLVAGSPGGRTIINTVLETILNVVDFGMNVQAAVDAPRFHHQWLPDEIVYERTGFSPAIVALLQALGYNLVAIGTQGVVEAIACDAGLLQGASDRRAPDGAAIAE